MAYRFTNRRRLKKYSIGDLRERIYIHSRGITAPNFDGVDFFETYDSGVGHWAAVETLDKKQALFGGVNIPEGATHSFVIRFDSNITSEYMIRWDGDTYEILKTSDPDKRKQYLELFSRLKGDQTLAAND